MHSRDDPRHGIGPRRPTPDGGRVPEPPTPPVSVSFTLYVAGRSARSRQAEEDLRRLGDARLDGAYTLAVVDVTVDGERAESARVLATPTLVKESPAPTRRVTGDLGDLDRLWALLDLDAPVAGSR